MKAILRDEREMKDSGIDWIAYIPNNWKVNVLFQVTSQVKNKNLELKEQNLLSLSYGKIKRKDINTNEGLLPASFENYNIVEKDDIVLRLTDLQNDHKSLRVGHVNERGIITSAYVTLHPNVFINSNYLYYVLHMFDLKKGFYGMGAGVRQGLTYDEVKTLKICYPSMLEQQAIANYLDDRCSKIDTIIAEAKASIEEYKELKQAVIDKYILGYNDIHIKLNRLGSLKNGLNFTHFEENGNIKFLGVGCFKDNTILSKEDSFENIHIDFEIDDEYLLINGDIIFVRSNGSKDLVGRSIMVDNITFPLTYSGFCIRFRNQHTEIVDSKFLLYYFRTSYFKESLLKHSNDSTNINNLNQGMLNAIRISAPIKNEQLMVIEKLEKKLCTMEDVISEKQSLIEDLEAYKKSLIYEVVTGKRKVVA